MSFRLILKRFLLILLGSFVIFLLGIAILGRVFQKRPALIPVPKNVPSGFIRSKNIAYGYNEGNRFYYFTYISSKNESFAYWTEFGTSENLVCNPSSDYSYVSEFLPEKASEGCVINSVNNEGENETIYTWIRENNRYAIIVENDSLTRSEVGGIASGLKLRVFIIDLNNAQTNTQY